MRNSERLCYFLSFKKKESHKQECKIPDVNKACLTFLFKETQEFFTVRSMQNLLAYLADGQESSIIEVTDGDSLILEVTHRNS